MRRCNVFSFGVQTDTSSFMRRLRTYAISMIPRRCGGLLLGSPGAFDLAGSILQQRCSMSFFFVLVESFVAYSFGILFRARMDSSQVNVVILSLGFMEFTIRILSSMVAQTIMHHRRHSTKV